MQRDRTPKIQTTNRSGWYVLEFFTVQRRRSRYHKLNDELDACRLRYVSIPKSKPAEFLDAKNLLTATQGVFVHASLDYAYKLNVTLSREHSVVIERLVAYMYAVNMFYVQGTDTMADVDVFLKQTAKDMSTAAVRCRIGPESCDRNAIPL